MYNGDDHSVITFFAIIICSAVIDRLSQWRISKRTILQSLKSMFCKNT